MSAKLVVYLCVIILTFGLEAMEVPRSSFGEECSKAKKCDRKAWLSCHYGVCDCSRPEEMFYDGARGKCVTKSGERCKYGVEEDGESSLVEITDCVTNSKCEEDGICTCKSQFHEVFNGTCVPSKLLGQSCSEEDKCSKYLQLNCINGVCNCKDGISVYSEKIDQCVGTLNENCVDGKCLDGTECREGKCFCDIDHYENTTTKTCVLRKSIHEECNDDSECIHKGLFIMKCIQGKCECDEGFKFSKVQKSYYTVQQQNKNFGWYSYFKFTTEEPFVELCAPIVGKECSDGYCVKNSQCKMSPQQLQDYYDLYKNDESITVLSNERGVCKCESAEYPTPNRDNSGCGKKWNEGYCITNDDCLNNLVCYDWKCQCPSSVHQIVNAAGDYCLIKVGGLCSDSSDCVSNSHCKLLPNTTVGHCLCNEGFVGSIQRECEQRHGTTCNFDHSRQNRVLCDQFAGLVCINQKCSCKDNFMYKYSETLRKCVGMVGADCQGKNSCIENAECFPFYNNLELPGRCKCKPGFAENTNYTCEALIDEL